GECIEVPASQAQGRRPDEDQDRTGHWPGDRDLGGIWLMAAAEKNLQDALLEIGSNFFLVKFAGKCKHAPIEWQAGTFPEPFRSRITVVHDGIDTAAVLPDPAVRLTVNGNLVLSKKDEVITFVNRNLEPYRGYHIFMRSLPEILKRRPKARVLIVGGDKVSYGAKPESGHTWKALFAQEVRPQISDGDWARVHFLGNIPFSQFISLLQLSTVHLYLTYPFVLSWSLLEAMSSGCAVVASNTAPLHEAIHHDETGLLVDFFDIQGLLNSVCTLLEDPSERARLGANARAFARANYDLKSVCLPRQMAWVNRLAENIVVSSQEVSA
ncbi:MAG: glycosyltransferase, partial [Geobacteraceae bacterium]|nr:glycosyltransferase [Geobacteraceae bacterium]